MVIECKNNNHALNTFYLRLYGVGHMVKQNSVSERGIPHGLVFLRNNAMEIPREIDLWTYGLMGTLALYRERKKGKGSKTRV